MSPQLPPRPLGVHLWDLFLFSLVTLVQLSLPMPTVYGWSTQGLGILSSPLYHVWARGPRRPGRAQGTAEL